MKWIDKIRSIFKPPETIVETIPKKVLSDLNVYDDVWIKDKNKLLVEDAKRYIEDNFDKQIKLKDIADSVHLSEIYFHNIFTESIGISPHQYLINCRIENVKKLLWNTNIPICEVAEKAGLGCQQYLNKVFKRETNMTPAAYRKLCQKNYILE